MRVCTDLNLVCYNSVSGQGQLLWLVRRRQVQAVGQASRGDLKSRKRRWSPPAAEKVGDVVQLVRTLPCHGRGRGFESRRPRHSFEWFTKNPENRSGSVWVQ